MAADIYADLETWRASWEGDDVDEHDDDETPYRLFATAAEMLDSITDPEDWGYVPDPRPLVGAYSPAGPDVGRSTTWPDIAEQIERRAREIAKHPWWDENPHALRPAASEKCNT